MVNTFLIRIFVKLYKKYCRFLKNNLQQRLINKIENNSLRSFSKALNYANNGIITNEESKLIKRIEDLRDNLIKSNQIINVIDYGAGSSNIKEMKHDKSNFLIFKETIADAVRPSINKRWALLLFKIIREFKPQTCLELGTCVGISALYQSMALELNQNGKLFTIEGAPSVADIAMDNLKKFSTKRVSVEIGQFKDILPELLPKIKPIDFAFIDGHHNEKATLNYFEKIYPFLNKNAILLFDDIGWSKGMRNAWKILEKDKRIKYTIDLWSMGFCIITPSNRKKQQFKYLYE